MSRLMRTQPGHGVGMSKIHDVDKAARWLAICPLHRKTKKKKTHTRAHARTNTNTNTNTHTHTHTHIRTLLAVLSCYCVPDVHSVFSRTDARVSVHGRLFSLFFFISSSFGPFPSLAAVATRLFMHAAARMHTRLLVTEEGMSASKQKQDIKKRCHRQKRMRAHATKNKQYTPIPKDEHADGVGFGRGRAHARARTHARTQATGANGMGGEEKAKKKRGASQNKNKEEKTTLPYPTVHRPHLKKKKNKERYPLNRIPYVTECGGTRREERASPSIVSQRRRCHHHQHHH